MIPSEVNKGERSHERLVKDVHSELKAPLTGANLWDSLDYFEISQAMRKRLNALFPGFEGFHVRRLPVTGIIIRDLSPGGIQ